MHACYEKRRNKHTSGQWQANEQSPAAAQRAATLVSSKSSAGLEGLVVLVPPGKGRFALEALELALPLRLAAVAPETLRNPNRCDKSRSKFAHLRELEKFRRAARWPTAMSALPAASTDQGGESREKFNAKQTCGESEKQFYPDLDLKG